jgi:hypothetical protein
MKKVLVLGASPNPERYSYKAVRSLIKRNFEVIPVGNRPGTIEGLTIATEKPAVKEVHTLLLYLSPDRQKDFYEYILQLMPARVVFNPGTENPELINLCKDNHIGVVMDCALVMLSTGIF